MLRIYRNHGRALLFAGDLDAAESRGIRIRKSDWTVLLDGRRWKIVNHAGLASDSPSFWVA